MPTITDIQTDCLSLCRIEEGGREGGREGGSEGGREGGKEMMEVN